MHCLGAAPPPLVCPAGAPIGSVDLRVRSPGKGPEALPLRSINRLEEGDTIFYRPILRSSEERKCDVTLVLVPAHHSKDDDQLVILEPKDAGKSESWPMPFRVAVVAYVYGPSGLNRNRVKSFLSRDSELIAQLADYAEKTAQTEALIAALSAPATSGANLQAALQGFSAQYGSPAALGAGPVDQQALALLRALNPAVARYDPLAPQRTQQLGQTAGLATSVAALFFGSPVGLAAGGTAMLLQLRAIAFPNSEFRSSFAQPLPGDGLGLCGRRQPPPPHTKVAYLWASRVPNVRPPALAIEKENSLPPGTRLPLPITATSADWEHAGRARGWALEPEGGGRPVAIKTGKLTGSKLLEVEIPSGVKPGRYTLTARWDWDEFSVRGAVDIKPLDSFAAAKLLPASQDLLVAKTGKIPVTLEGSDFEFVTKVEIERKGDRFAAPAPVPFILPLGLRRGTQERLDVQINTVELEPGDYNLSLTQLAGKRHSLEIKILPPPPKVDNLPAVLNQGAAETHYTLQGNGLDRLERLEVARGEAKLGPPGPTGAERCLTLRMSKEIAAGTSLALKAYIRDRSAPLTFSDAVRIVGPRPRITAATVSPPPDHDVQMRAGELPGGFYLSAMLKVEHLQSNSSLRLACEQPDTPVVKMRLGERSGPLNLQQLAPGQLFLSFDTAAWLNGCALHAILVNGKEGESDPFPLGTIVRIPRIEQLTSNPGDSPGDVDTTVTGINLETMEKAGWTADAPIAVTSLPLPIDGDASRQALQLRLGPPPSPATGFYVWLRGEGDARAVRLHP